MYSPLVKLIVDTARRSVDEVLTEKGKIYTFLNPVSYLQALQHKARFTAFDGLYPDGSLLVAAIRLVYGARVPRVSFDMTSLAPKLFAYAASAGKSVYVVASTDEQVERAVSVLQSRYPALRIVGFRNGYFSDETQERKEIERIVTLAPDFLIVGMGAIRQEAFLLAAKAAGYGGIGFTCGGFIHQLASKEEAGAYYPDWINRLNLRFLYRIVKERHTRKRYLEAAWLFPIRFIYERLFE